MATPSLAMIPSGKKEGVLYSAISQTHQLGISQWKEVRMLLLLIQHGLIQSTNVIGGEKVLNGNFSQEGSEQITNGNFATDSDWTKGTEWSISGGSANYANASASGISQAKVLDSNKTYKISFDYNGTGKVGFYGTSGGANPLKGFEYYSNGNNVIYVTPTSTTSDFSIWGNLTGSFSIDNVSVKEVGQNWESFNANASIGEDKIVCNNVVQNVNIAAQVGVVPLSKPIKLQYDVVLNSGSFRVLSGSGGTSTTISASGTYTHYETSGTGGTLTLQARSGGFDGSVSNISLKEVTEATNTPRIDYTDGGCPVLLTEPQRTNEIPFSNDFSNAIWTESNITTVSSNEVNPSGGSSTYKINTNVGSTVNSSFIYETLSGLTPSVAHSFSVFAKKGGYDGFKVLFDDGSNLANKAEAIFNLNDGSITSVQAVGTFSDATANVEDFGNGWYRLIVSSVISSTGATRARFYNNDTTITVGDGTKGAYAYGAQFEEGSYSTSLIPTYGSPYTRLGEVVKDAGDVNTFNSTEGVLFAEISALANDLTNRYISINDGATGNSIRFYYSTTSQTFRARYYVGGAAQCSLVYVATDLTQSAKIAFKWKVNDFALWVDGVEVHTDDSGTVNPTNTFDRLDFKFINIESFYGKTSQIQVFNTALTDVELADLTTPITYDSFNEMANALNLTII